MSNKVEELDKMKTPKKAQSFLGVILYMFIGFLLLFSMLWALKEIRGISLSIIIFNLLMPMGGVDWGVVISYLLKGLLPSVGATLAIVIIVIVFKKNGKLKDKLAKLRKMLLIAASAMLVVNVIKFWVDFKVPAFFKSQLIKSEFVENNFVSPKDVKITFPEKKRNLVYIYLESMETTFLDKADGGAFDYDIIPGLTEIAKDKNNISFSSREEGKLGGAYESTYSAWTIASFFGQTTGLPFKLPIRNNDMDKYEIFMPGAITLGEILKDNGYKNYLVQGSSIIYSGTSTFVKDHGDYTVYDYLYAKETGRIPEDYRVFWGMEDKKLFDMAKEKLTLVAAEGEPFNFTVFTIDSHYPEGYICDLCDDKYPTAYENAIACSAKQAIEFVEWIKTQDFYDNTTIILTGDHYTMSKEYAKVEARGYERRIYNAIINSGISPEGELYNRKFNVLDMFPTTLASIGATVEGDRLGLGTNLYSGKKTLCEEYGIDKFEEELAKKSVFYDNFIVKGKEVK